MQRNNQLLYKVAGESRPNIEVQTIRERTDHPASPTSDHRLRYGWATLRGVHVRHRESLHLGIDTVLTAPSTVQLALIT